MRVAVVGAGITGLCCAWRLQQLGVAVTVFESTDTIGGPIRTARRGEFLAESGPHTFTLRPELAALLSQLGLSHLHTSPAARQRFLVRDGALHALPASPPALLRSPVYTRAAKLALLREPFKPRRADQLDESVANFVTRRLSAEWLDYGIELLVNGVWAGDPNKLSMRYAFPRLWALERDHGSLLLGARAASRPPAIIALRDGNGALCDALAAQLDDLRLDTAVHTIARDHDWRVNGERYDRVVLTVGANALANLDIRDGDRVELDFARAIPAPPLTVVTLGFRRADVAHPLDGFGLIAPVRERLDILGALFTSTLFPNRAPAGHVTIACFLGGARNPDLATAPDRLPRLHAALKTLLGVRADPIFVDESIHARAIPQVEVGYGRHLARFDAVEQKHRGLHIAGNIRGRVAVPDLIADAHALAEASGSAP